MTICYDFLASASNTIMTIECDCFFSLFCNKRVEVCKSYAEANNLPLESCVRMYLRTFSDYAMEDMQKAIDQYKPYIDTTDLETEFLS